MKPECLPAFEASVLSRWDLKCRGAVVNLVWLAVLPESIIVYERDHSVDALT